MLVGAEADLVRTGIDALIDSLTMSFDYGWEDDADVEFDCPTGVSLFDSLSPTQRIGALHDVARDLLTPTPPPPLTAINEATVAAIYLEIRDQVAIEIDFREDPADASPLPSWRTLVLDAISDDPATAADAQQVPSHWPRDASCKDIAAWTDMIDCLADRILWDRDFEMADLFMDVDPSIARERRSMLGIAKNYFTEVVTDPRPVDVARLINATRALVRSKPR